MVKSKGVLGEGIVNHRNLLRRWEVRVMILHGSQ
jgi:hypothetical protein